MRGLIQSTGATKRGLERSRRGRKLARYGSTLSLLGVMAAGCAAQDAGDETPTAGSSSGGTTSTAGTSANAGTANAGTSNLAGSVNGGGANGGSAAAGAAGNQSTGGSGGVGGANGGSGGKGGNAGAGGSAGNAGNGGKGGSGGTAGASGNAGAGGSAGASGSAGNSGSAGTGGSAGNAGTGGSGGTGTCSVVTDCAAQFVCEASQCRARGCNATNCAYDLKTFVVGTAVAASARGQAFVTWDATKLNVDFQVLDKTAQNDSANNWEDDSVELYVDLNHARTGAYDADDFQINVPRDAGTLVGIGNGINFGSITVTRIENANGYELKVSVPWSAFNGAGSQVGKTIGFDLAINDDRDGATRETQVLLYGNQNAYQDDTQFGDLTLTAP